MRKRARMHVVGVVLDCRECGACFDDHETGRREAQAHARKTGHAVQGEITYAITYSYPSSRSPRP